MWWLSALAFAGGTVEVGSLSVDGLELRDLSCQLDGGMLFGPLTVAAALAQAKPALDACGPDGQAFRVGFTWSGESKVEVEASSATDKAAACVRAAIASVPPVARGKCTIVVLTGPTSAAEAARSRLPARP